MKQLKHEYASHTGHQSNSKQISRNWPLFMAKVFAHFSAKVCWTNFTSSFIKTYSRISSFWLLFYMWSSSVDRQVTASLPTPLIYLNKIQNYQKKSLKVTIRRWISISNFSTKNRHLFIQTPIVGLRGKNSKKWSKVQFWPVLGTFFLNFFCSSDTEGFGAGWGGGILLRI